MSAMIHKKLSSVLQGMMKAGAGPAKAQPAAVPQARADSAWQPQKVPAAKMLMDGFTNALTSSTARQNASSQMRAAQDGVVSQSEVNPNGTVNTRTEAKAINASPEQVLEKIMGPWTEWWGGSSLDSRSKDGSDFTIRPLGPKYLGAPGPAVSIQLGKPSITENNGVKSIRVPMEFSGDFTSNPAKPSYIEIKQGPNGTSSVSFNWNEAFVTGALKNHPGLAIGLHTRALEGDTAFRDGAGLEGLVRLFAQGR